MVLIAADAKPASAIELRLGRDRLRIDITETLGVNGYLYAGNPDATQGYYGEVVSRLNVQLAWRKLLVGVRLDTAGYFAEPGPGRDLRDFPLTHPSCRIAEGEMGWNPACKVRPMDPRLVDRFQQRPVFLEKLFLSYSGRALEATLGDYYVNFGRGLVLSIRKVDELGVDTTLRGGKLVLHVGKFSGVALVGWANYQNVDEATARFTVGRFDESPMAKAPANDPYLCLFLVVGCNDLIAAAHMDYHFGPVLVGAHVVGGKPALNRIINRPGELNPVPDDFYVRTGLVFDAPKLTDWLSLYLEYAHSEDQAAGKPVRGDAIYGAATAYAGRSVWLLEFKNYENYRPWFASVANKTNPLATSLVYMQPPTLERVTTQLSNNHDILAARLRVDLRVAPFNLFASVELGQHHPTPESTETLFDSYAGLELRWNQNRSHWFQLLGYRREHDSVGHKLVEELVAVEWDVAQALPKGISLELAGQVWVRSKPLTSPDDNKWQEGNVYLAFKWTPKIIATVGYEFNTIPKQAQNQQHFVNGSLQWNITPGTSLRLFAGGNRPGLRCVSGVCRDFPAFQGVKLELVLRL